MSRDEFNVLRNHTRVNNSRKSLQKDLSRPASQRGQVAPANANNEDSIPSDSKEDAGSDAFQ